EREQKRPAAWPREKWQAPAEFDEASMQWVRVGQVSDFPQDGGAPVNYGNVQIAVFNFSSRGEWFASQNMCPHKRDLVLARGIVGEAGGVPKVACPMHKKTFALSSGQCLSGDCGNIYAFQVRVDGDTVLVRLPPAHLLEQALNASAAVVGPVRAR
ncbi:MAG: nitrite reductase small subunit NirD, partial [Candidatus Hydrogenedentes bacterium]|nr:nitrite reductase small subunit NirD [Candidatus Hydrogenedentota bacterium]